MLGVLPVLSARVRLVLLVAVAGVSAGIYASLTAVMSLDEFFPGPGATLDFQFMLGDDWVANTWRLYGSFGALFLLWGGALWAASGLRVSRRAVAVVAVGGVAMAGALVPMYPPFAVDLFHYLGEGRLLWVEGENPMVRGPGEFFPIGMSYGDEAAAYGPLWYWTLGPPVLAGGDDFPRSLLLLKGWMVGWVGLSAVLGALISRALARIEVPARDGRELLVAVAIGWNPYVLWRVAGNGHNDITMMALVLLALWLAVTAVSSGRTSVGVVAEGPVRGWWRRAFGGRGRWVLPAIVGSVLVKYVSLLLLPVLAVFLLRRSAGERRALLTELAIGAGISAVLVAVAFAPMWDGLAVFDQLRAQSDRVITSTPELISIVAHRDFNVSPERADEIGLRVGAVAFLLAMAVLLWRQRPGPEALIVGSASVLLAYALLGVGWFRPWYFLWVVTLMPLLPGRWWLGLAVVCSVAGLAPDVAEKYAVFVPVLRPLTREHPSLPAMLAQFVVPAVVWGTALVATRSVGLRGASERSGGGTAAG